MEIFDLPGDVVERGTSVEELVRLNAARGEFGQDDPDGVGRLAAIQTFPFTIDHTRPDGTVLKIRGNAFPAVAAFTPIPMSPGGKSPKTNWWWRWKK